MRKGDVTIILLPPTPGPVRVGAMSTHIIAFEANSNRAALQSFNRRVVLPMTLDHADVNHNDLILKTDYPADIEYGDVVLVPAGVRARVTKDGNNTPAATFITEDGKPKVFPPDLSGLSAVRRYMVIGATPASATTRVPRGITVKQGTYLLIAIGNN